MIRHHKIDTNIPFSENLIFYAPLTQGDLTDHISGVELANVGSSYVTWESEYEAYRFIKQTKANENAFYTSILYDATTFPKGLKKEIAQTYTISVICKRLSSPYYAYPAYMTIGSYQSGTWIPYIESNDKEGAQRELFIRRTTCFVPANNAVYYYSGSTIIRTGTMDSGGNVANWSRDFANLGYQISVNPRRDNNDSPDALLKDIRIYNRALTAQEVAQL